MYRNRLIELIQYEPTTQTVHKTPLLIMPPWINKFYIMDMQPKNSMVRFLVEQGLYGVRRLLEKSRCFDGGHVFRGLYGSRAVGSERGGTRHHRQPEAERDGYCIGGTLLAMALAWLTAKGDERFNAATFMVSLQDFSRVGDTAVFLGEPTIDLIEQQMMERGYLDSREMSNMFNLLRSNDLIWSNVVNNYLLGTEAAGLRSAVLEQRRHAHGSGRAQLVPAQHLCREQPDQAGQGRA